MGQSQAKPRQPPKGIVIRHLQEENYGKIVYPSYKDRKEQFLYIRDILLRKFDFPVHVNGIDMYYYIPKGTKLYHGSLDFYLTFDPTCMTCAPDRLTFFGLDIAISLWYLYEMNLRQDKPYGVIYEFDVVEDIPIHVIQDIYEHPTSDKKCLTKGVACVHPQYAYHGNEGSFGELSMEMTMNLSDDGLRQSIRRSIHPTEGIPITYVVNLRRLEDMAGYGKLTIQNFNPIRPNVSKLAPSVQTRIKGELKSVIEGLLRPENIPSEKDERKETEKKGGRRKTRRGCRKRRRHSIKA